MEMKNMYKIFIGEPRGKNHPEDLGVDGMIILKRILGKYVGVRTGFIWLRIGTGGGLL
jgi:hypothetical protein